MDRTALSHGCIDGDTLARWPDSQPVSGWAIVPHNSTAEFAVRNFGVRTVHGVIPITDATVVVNGDPFSTDTDEQRSGGVPEVTAVRMTLNLAAIDTANSRRDKDLRARRLLDTEQHPVLAFDCTDVRTGPDGWQLNGTLSARGLSAPVTVHAVLSSGPVRDLITVRATTKFDRRALGVSAPRLMIGHEVVVDVCAQFRRVPVGG